MKTTNSNHDVLVRAARLIQEQAIRVFGPGGAINANELHLLLADKCVEAKKRVSFGACMRAAKEALRA